MTENKLKKIWAKALNCQYQEIDINASFIDLGGESLAFVILVDMLEKKFGANYDFFSLGMNMTITQLIIFVGE